MTILVLLAIYIALSLALGLWARRKAQWLQRLNDCNWRAITLFVDEVPTFVIIFPLYLLRLFPRRPMVGDTLSALAWWGGRNGVAWCKPVRVALDAVFLLAGQRDHCRKAFEGWANPLGSTHGETA